MSFSMSKHATLSLQSNPIWWIGEQVSRKEYGDLNEVASDIDDDKVNDDDDDANSKDIEVAEIGTEEALSLLGRLVNLKDLSKEKRNSLVAMKDKLAKIRVLNKKQSHINDYFMLEQSLYDRFY